MDILLHDPIMKRHVLIFGLAGGLLIATLQYTEYRLVIIEHSIELYGALVAILFATFGIWLGLRITRRRETIRETVVVREVLVPAEAPAPAPAPRQDQAPFAPNTAHQQTLGYHGARARNPHPGRSRLQQSRDRHAAFRLQKPRKDALPPRLEQAGSPPPHPG